jgi:hypothetical protein
VVVISSNLPILNAENDFIDEPLKKVHDLMIFRNLITNSTQFSASRQENSSNKIGQPLNRNE